MAKEIKREPSTYPLGDATGHHVHLSNGLDLVHVVEFNAGVKHLVEGIQERNHLQENSEQKKRAYEAVGKRLMK